MQFSDAKDLKIKQLENENLQLHKQIKELEHNVEVLTQAVLHAAKQRFGASSEKTPKIDGQCSFLDEASDEISEDVKVIKIKEHKRPVRKKGDREKLIKSLPHETIECVLEPDDKICKICGSELKIIGKKKIRSEIEYIPAKLVVKDYIQYVYKCTNCGTNDINPYDAIYCAPVPKPILTHSLASPSIVSWVMYEKYMMSVPLYRQEKDFRRMGAELNRDMMANWIIRSTEYWLKPIYEKMHEKLLTHDIIMSDETTWQVNKEPGKKASSKSYIWIHRTGNYEKHPIILYQYTSSRAGEHAKEFLMGFEGYHVSDAYAGYEKVKGITRCLCFSHLRRYYIESIPLDSNKNEISGSGGSIGRVYCDKLFALEKKWKNLTPQERKTNRIKESLPVLEAFFAWAEKTFTTSPTLQKALNYTLNHKKYFSNFLLDGRIPISNNLSEIAVKPVAITRKNSLFSDSPAGAKASAIVFSIINTAVVNNLDCYKYLKYIFCNLPNINFKSNSNILEDYLPWSQKIQDQCGLDANNLEKENAYEPG